MTETWIQYDIILNITGYLNDKNNISLLSTNILLHKMKNKIIYRDQVNINRIQYLWYIDQIINISITDDSTLLYKIPKNVANVTLHNNGTYNNIYSRPSITHLTFDVEKYDTIKNCIPPNITHLVFRHFFDAKIKNYFPISVTHLTFNAYGDSSIQNSIPLTVTHLSLGCCNYICNIKDCIPASVRYLRLNGHIVHIQ